LAVKRTAIKIPASQILYLTGRLIIINAYLPGGREYAKSVMKRLTIIE
jgi:hypothetical protein